MPVVFLVDDDPDDRYLLRESIQSVDKAVEIIEACDGQDFFDKVAIQKAECISLVLIDMNMPKMNGLETIGRIKTRKELKHIPLVMVSTSEHNAIRQKSIDAGSAQFILKPNSFEKFVSIAKDLKEKYLM